MRLVEIPESNKPACPNALHPIHPSHLLHTRLVDAAYDAIRTDPDTSEIVNPEQEKVYVAVANGHITDAMNLYTTGVTLYNPRVVYIESWFFRCSICGLILPATREVR